MKHIALVFLAALTAFGAEKPTTRQLIELAQKSPDSAAFREGLMAALVERI